MPRARRPAVTRPADRTDAGRIAEIAVAGWTTAYAEIVPQAVRDRQTVERHVEYWLAEEAYQLPMRTWVATTDGLVVGFAHTGPFRPEAGESGDAGELWGIYVDPSRFGQGIGRALMASALDGLASDGYTTAHLWVLQENSRARRFYEEAGWTIDTNTKVIDLGTPLTVVRYTYRLAA